MAVSVRLVASTAAAVDYNYSTVTLTGTFPVGLAVFFAATNDQPLRDGTFDGQPIAPLRSLAEENRQAVLFVAEVLTAGTHTFTISYNYNKTVAAAVWSVTGAKKIPTGSFLYKHPGYPNEDTPIVTRPLSFAAGGGGIAALLTTGGGYEHGGDTRWYSPAVEDFDTVFANEGSAYTSGAHYGVPATPTFTGHRFSGPAVMGIAFDPDSQGIVGAGASSLAPLGSAAIGTHAVRAVAAQTLGGIASQAIGQAPASAAAAAVLQPLTGLAPSRVGVSGIAATTIGEITGSAAATRTATLSASTLTTLAPVASVATGQAAVTGSGVTQLGAIEAGGAGGATIRAAGAGAIGGIEVGPTGRLSVTAGGAAQLAQIGAAASAGAQASLVAASASVLASIASDAVARTTIVAVGVVTIDAIGSSSGAAAPVRAAGAAASGDLAGLATARLSVSAASTRSLDSIIGIAAARLVASASGAAALVQLEAHSGATLGIRAAGILSLAHIDSLASGTSDIGPAAGPTGPCWTAIVAPRLFSAAATPRRFSAVSTGCKRMIDFPPKYAHEVRHAAVDFAPALAAGESLVGVPTVKVSRGTLTTSGARVDGSAVRLTLSGGSMLPHPVQRIEISCPTSTGQVLEEIVLMTMLSAP